MLKKFKYNFLSFLHFLCILIAVWIPRFAIFGIIYFTMTYFISNEFIGNGFTGYIIGMIVAGILIKIIEKKSNLIESIEKRAISFKSFPYIEKYGVKFNKPELEEFKITHSEYISYNTRFQLNDIKIIVLAVLTCIFFYDVKIGGTQIFLRIAALFIIYYLFGYLNKEISKRHMNFKKINNYQNQLKIYNEILKEKAYKNRKR